MKIFELLRNPLIKGIGIVSILYFALFANKEKPDSLGNRLSSEQIKQNLSEIQAKSKFIAVNIKAAQDLAKEKEAQRKIAEQNMSQISSSDLEIGSAEPDAACGDEVEISYGIYSSEGKQLDFVNSKKFIIGSESEAFFGKKIIGMKRDGIREIVIPSHFSTSDEKLNELQKSSNGDLKYQVTMLAVTKPANPPTTSSCE